MRDLVIRGGFVVDGTGRRWRIADLVANDGVIAEVVDADSGERAGEGARAIDATARLVTPGWVDIHTHYDGQASWDPYLTPSSWHGVTTAVMGTCGVGFAPAAPDRHEWLTELMEGADDIPGTALTAGLAWDWESFEDYLDALDKRRFVIDIGAQVAHGPVRCSVIGDRGAANEAPTVDDIAVMADIVERGCPTRLAPREPPSPRRSDRCPPGPVQEPSGAGRVVGLLMCLEGSFNPLAFHPGYAAIADLALAGRAAALADPGLRDEFAVAPVDGGALYQQLVLDRLDRFWAVHDGDIDDEPPPTSRSPPLPNATVRVRPT